MLTLAIGKRLADGRSLASRAALLLGVDAVQADNLTAVADIGPVIQNVDKVV